MAKPRYIQVGMDVIVSREGDLILPFYGFSDRVANSERKNPSHWMVSSVDGGKSFSKAWELRTGVGAPLIEGATNFPSFAIDASGRKFNDRIYSVWVDNKGPEGTWRLLFSSSTDLGNSWEMPKTLEHIIQPLSVSKRKEVQEIPIPLVHVNNVGHVLLSWYRFSVGIPDSAGRSTFDHQRYGMASVDGGASFTSAQPIASSLSRDYRPPIPLATYPDTPTMDGEPNPNGELGHYMKVVSDSNGSFHLAWLDGRTGKQEIWYASVDIQCR